MTCGCNAKCLLHVLEVLSRSPSDASQPCYCIQRVARLCHCSCKHFMDMFPLKGDGFCMYTCATLPHEVACRASCDDTNQRWDLKHVTVVTGPRSQILL